MRLLITTQAVDLDDPILGFFHRWLEEFAKHCEHVHVVCLKEGRHELPSNVSVHSLGKEVGPSRLNYVLRFYRYIYTLRRQYDGVFVHMNPEYVVLGGPFWRQWDKPIGLWYVHRSQNGWLRVAMRFANQVFTSATQSIPSRSTKISVVGHGVDTAMFAVAHAPRSLTAPRIVSIGRIAAIKHLETIIEAVILLRARGVQASLDLVGEPVMQKDHAYQAALKKLLRERGATDYVHFRGSVPPSQMPALFVGSDLSVNASPTGGIDKAVLESFAAGVPTFFCNESFLDFLGPSSEQFKFTFENPNNLADTIEKFLHAPDAATSTDAMRTLVQERADVRVLIGRIMEWFTSVV